MYDVLVLGGGPAGLYSAVQLASNGYDTVVLEEHVTVGQPVHCTGVLAPEAYGEFQIPENAILNPLSTVSFVAPSGKGFTYSTEKVEAVVIDRHQFDGKLAELARDGGAQLLYGSKVVDLKISASEVSVRYTTADKQEVSLRARVCVLACGANYTFHKRLRLDGPTAFLQTAQVELPAEKEHALEVHFGESVAPKGFAWAVPVKRGVDWNARIGLMCADRASFYFSNFLSSVTPTWGLEPGSRVIPRRKILPLGPIPKTYGARLIVIGDAAGIVKPTTGGGIYYSLLSAKLASEVLIDLLSSDRLKEEDLSSYEKLWKERLSSEFRAQSTLRVLAERLRDSEIEQLFDLAKTDGLIPLVKRAAQFNRHRPFILELLKHQDARKILFRRTVGLTV